MASFVPAELVAVTVLGTGAAALYTAATATAIVRKASVVNRSGASTTVSLYKVPAGGSPTSSNLIISAQPIAAGESWIINELNGMVFTPGESLQGLAGAGSAVNFMASGILYTP